MPCRMSQKPFEIVEAFNGDYRGDPEKDDRGKCEDDQPYDRSAIHCRDLLQKSYGAAIIFV